MKLGAVSTKILKAMGIFTGVQGVGMLCSIVRAKLISLWIGPAGVGLFAIFNSVIDMVGNASQLNLRHSSVRDISAASSSSLPAVAGSVRWWSRYLGIAGAVLMIVLSPLLSIVSFGDTRYWWAFAALSVVVGANSLSSGEQALLQGTSRLRRLARASLAGAVTGTAVSIPMYYFLGEASIVPSLLVFGIVGALAYRLSCDVTTAKNPRSANIAIGRGFLRLGAYMTVSSVVTTVASYAFLSYLNHVGGEATVGFYQAGYTLVIRYTGIVFTALSMEFFPRVSLVADRPKMASTVVSHEISLILGVLTPLVVAFVFLSPLALRLLYTAEFLQAVPFVAVGIGAMIFRAVSFCMAYVIIGRGDGRTYIVTEVTSALVGLSLNIAMYHFWGMAGLGLSYILWYMLYTAMVWIVCHRYGMRLHRRTIATIAISVIITAAAIAIHSFPG